MSLVDWKNQRNSRHLPLHKSSHGNHKKYNETAPSLPIHLEAFTHLHFTFIRKKISVFVAIFWIDAEMCLCSSVLGSMKDLHASIEILQAAGAIKHKNQKGSHNSVFWIVGILLINEIFVRKKWPDDCSFFQLFKFLKPDSISQNKTKIIQTPHFICRIPRLFAKWHTPVRTQTFKSKHIHTFF